MGVQTVKRDDACLSPSDGAGAGFEPRAPLDFTQERLLRLFTTAPGAFWRFDVDVSLAAAVKMARFAHLAGVSATFYLMPRADFYNLFGREGARAILEIRRAGHRLGLHSTMDPGWRDPTAVVAYERALLDAGYPDTFGDTVSFHMPESYVLWRDFDSFESAYAAEWEGRYLSDARREFGPEKEALVSDDMQIALHAEHWFG